MTESMALLRKMRGRYAGGGINHENQEFSSTMSLQEAASGRGFSLDYRAVGTDGTVYHEEHTLIGPNLRGGVSMWVMSSSHPGVVEHELMATKINGPSQRADFRYGNPENDKEFREVITLEQSEDASVTHSYAWGMPGGDYGPRSSCRMTRLQMP